MTESQDGATLMVLTTEGDGPADWLRAGEAMSAALLVATRIGLATTVLSQAAEVADTRRKLADVVLRVPEHAQLVLRVGRAPVGAPALTAAPRRSLSSVLMRDPAQFTAPERRVLELLAAGLPTVAIARRLGVATKTVSNTLSTIFAKLGVTNRTQAALLARRAGLDGERERKR